MKLQRLTWKQFDEACLTLASVIKIARTKFSGIYGIPRGGLVVAVKLSHLLDLPLVLDVKDTKWNTLIVDDIADTGKTLKQFKNENIYLAVATIFCHPNSVVTPEIWVIRKESDWVVFPWEQMKCYDPIALPSYCTPDCKYWMKNYDCPLNHKEEEYAKGSSPQEIT